MSFSRLKVYKSCMDLMTSLNVNTQKGCPKWVQIQVIEPLKASVVSVMINLLDAQFQSEKHKIPLILDALRRILRLKYTMRVLADCRYITVTGFGEISRRHEDVRDQLARWASSLGCTEPLLDFQPDIYDKGDTVL